MSAQQSTQAYTYDALGRLVQVEVAGGQNNSDARAICYDDAGNRISYIAASGSTGAGCTGTPPPPPPPPP
ncbi:MAG: hypothetical protein ABJF50_17155, partial [Paracoccaceae bacterium]